MSNSYIVGWGHTPFGKLDKLDLEQLIRDAVQPALDSAGLEPKDIDGIFLGHFNAGFVGQDFTASLPAVAMPEFRHTPAVRTENACATGSAAIWAALDAMAAGRMKRTLVIGMEKMNELTTPQVAATLIKCSYVKEEGTDPAGFAGISEASRPGTSSASATSPMRWPRSRPRTTATACTTPMPTCGATSGSISAARPPRRTRSCPVL
jgi:acetyl-CoA C-acetyltransferase